MAGPFEDLVEEGEVAVLDFEPVDLVERGVEHGVEGLGLAGGLV